jgi:hypothetical protein
MFIAYFSISRMSRVKVDKYNLVEGEWFHGVQVVISDQGEQDIHDFAA